MSVRNADTSDAARIREIAQQTFQTSYSMSPGEIEVLVDELFDEESLRERATGTDQVILVDETEDGVVGFADLSLESGVLQWLHVEPGHRGAGVGTRLFEAARDATAERDVSLEARVLSEDSEGSGFCERFGFERSDEAKLEVGSEELFEYVYTADGDETDPMEPSVEVPATVTVEGTERPLDRDDEIPATQGPFYPIYEEDGLDERYGFFCLNCGSTDTASDGLGRLECQQCGNKHLADEWDAAYL